MWSIGQVAWVCVKVLTQGSDINLKTFFFFGIKWTWGLITISICVFLTDVEHLFGYVSFIQASSSVTCPFM